jgi:hypothetical protein
VAHNQEVRVVVMLDLGVVGTFDSVAGEVIANGEYHVSLLV